MPAGPAADTTACADPVAMVEAWKAAGSTAPDPVVLAVVESLARRAAAMPDEAARQWLVQRIQDRMTGQALGPARPTAAAGTVARPGLTALGELIDRLGRAPQATPVAPAPSAGHRGAPAPVSGRPAAPLAPAGVGLKSVTAFHGTWSRLRAEQRLRQALAQVPAMAGPLNSSQVVHRALQTMQVLSPAYLDAFLAHVDGLIALEQAAGAAEPAPRSAPPAEARRPRGAATARRKG